MVLKMSSYCYRSSSDKIVSHIYVFDLNVFLDIAGCEHP